MNNRIDRSLPEPETDDLGPAGAPRRRHSLFLKPPFTMGELADAVMAIHAPSDATAFYADYVSWLREKGNTPERSASVARENIGWFFGEGMPQADVNMWVATVEAYHPIFGTMDPPPTPEQALQAGLELGRQMNKRKGVQT